MLQVMVDTYGKEYEKLQQENKMLRDQLSASVKVNETKAPTDKVRLLLLQNSLSSFVFKHWVRFYLIFQFEYCL